MDDTIQFIQSTRARRLSIVVDSAGDVKVKMPMGFSRDNAERFVDSKKEWIADVVAKIRRRNEKHKDAIRLPRATRADLKKYKAEALKLVQGRLEYFNHRLYAGRFSWKRVTIRNTKTRWGSCSKRGNLNFSYRIVFLPKELVDYLVVHELCHLGEFNHSKKFWDLVSVAVPEYKRLRKELRMVR